MKQSLQFSILEIGKSDRPTGKKVPPEVFAQCKRFWPQFFRTGGCAMEVDAEEDSPVLHEVIAFLREQGREPCLKKFPHVSSDHPSLYSVSGLREFEAQDIEKADYFYFHPNQRIAQGTRRPETGLFEVDGKTLNKRVIGNSWRLHPLCSDGLRQELAASKFAGLSFREVLVRGGKATKPCLWELWSDRWMPPLLNRIIDKDGNDYAASARRGSFIDDFYWPAMLRFSCSAVRLLEPFDVALTQESFGDAPGPYLDPKCNWKNLHDPYLIVSRRFREWCEERELDLHWTPVFLE